MDEQKLITVRMPVTEAGFDARTMEAVVAEFGADAEFVRKSCISIKAPDIAEGERAVIAAVSTEAIDRDHEVMKLSGVDLKWYRKNPVVLYAHDYRSLPIGKAMWIRKEGDKLMAKTVFASAEANPVAENVYQLFREKILNAWSIGFIVHESREPKQDEFSEDVRRVITKWTLLEYSAVPVPSNMEALTTAVGKGLELVSRVADDLGLGECDDCKMDDAPDPDEGGKPYPSEHACRMKDPGGFQPDSFRRVSRNHDGKRYSVIMGKLKGETTMTEQAYRYPKTVWDTASARAHCKSHGGMTFEPASERGMDEDDIAELTLAECLDLIHENIPAKQPQPELITITAPQPTVIRIDNPKAFAERVSASIMDAAAKLLDEGIQSRIDRARGIVRER